MRPGDLLLLCRAAYRLAVKVVCRYTLDMTQTSTATATQPDAMTTGTCDDGNTWSVARFGTLVVLTFGEAQDDLQCATVEQAIAEYEDLVDVNSTAS